jgi:hypothetical protein
VIALLSPRLWIGLALVAALAFSHFTVYRKGANNVRLEWQAAVSAANSDARRLEQQRQRRADEADLLWSVRERGIRADADRARSAADGLRGDLDAIERASADSLAAANNAVRVLGDVFEQCSKEYLDLAREADRATSEALMLRQAWPAL